MPACPIHRGIAPETPNFGGAQGNLEPVMADEQEVARSFLQPVEVVPEGDITPEDIAQHFGWELGNVQQTVPSAFELDDDPLVLSDLLLQISDGFDVDLAAETIFDLVSLWYGD